MADTPTDKWADAVADLVANGPGDGALQRLIDAGVSVCAQLAAAERERDEARQQAAAAISIIEMWQEVDRSVATTRRYLALCDRRDTWLARYRASTAPVKPEPAP